MTKAEPVKHVSLLWAGAEHADMLAQLHASLFDSAWDASGFRALLVDPGSTALLARVGPETVGFVLGRVAADEAELLSVGVHQSWQRRGIGRRLVEAICRAARKAEAQRVFLEVAASNTAALGLYRHMGFREVGRRRGYYERAGHPPEDAINLALDV